MNEDFITRHRQLRIAADTVIGLSKAQERLLYGTPPVIMFGGMAYGVKTKTMSQKMFLIKRTKFLQSKSKQSRMTRVVIKY